MGKKLPENTAPAPVPPAAFAIRFPLLWLSLAVVVLYIPVVFMGMTDLDDGIFINANSDYNENLRNIFLAFGRTIWGSSADLMYRPVSTGITILNYHLSNHGANIAAFHIVNILLHLVAVLLLYKLLLRLQIKKTHAFILALVFAVHPVLTEAVAWISARIETMLCIFTLAFFIKSIDYADSKKIKDLLLSLLFLLLALFDKETAVAAAPAAFLLLAVVLKKDVRSRPFISQYCGWAACYALWFFARAAALSGHQQVAARHFFADSLYRMLTLVQYLGKIFFPFNLSVFPLQEDTGYIYGIAALILLTVLVFLSKDKKLRIVIGGAGLFLLFLAPTFFIPGSMNVQIYEYRVYVPFIGILLLCSQTPLLQNKLTDKQLLVRAAGLCALLAAINVYYQKSFSDPLSFWTQAEQSSPHSAYAKMMLSARVDDPARSDELFLEAYQLDPNERMLNFIYGVRLQDKDSVLASEKYLLAEKNKSGYYKCDFYLARVAIAKNDDKQAIAYLENYLTYDRDNPKANKNLLILYLDTDQDDKARQQAQRMKDAGLEVPRVVLQHFNMQ